MCCRCIMKIFLNRILISYRYTKRIIVELLIDLYQYYISLYPILLIIGAMKRIKRRLKYLWYPKGPGRPPVPENIVDLILDILSILNCSKFIFLASLMLVLVNLF